MILDALRAELFKLSRNRWSLFWAFGFVPLVALLGGIVLETVTRMQAPMLSFAAPIAAALDGLDTYSNLVLRIFPIAGAAILFAGEYRWETWRAILPRNERTIIMIAKLIAFAIAAALSIAACGVAGFITGLYEGALAGSLNWPTTDSLSVALALITGFGAIFLQLMATAGLVLIVACVSRAMIAAIIGPFFVLVAAELGATLLRLRIPQTDIVYAAFPNTAGEAISQLAISLSGDPDAFNTHLALPGALALIAWCAALSTAAIAIFKRQDLSKE